MKKSYLFGAIGALLLASCANDDLIVKPDTPTTGEAKQMPIELSMTTGNISRDAAGLNTMYYDFGVYAYKAKNQSELGNVTTTTVMSDYMVGFWDSPNGTEYVAYMPKDLDKIENINAAGNHTAWYYNGLGSAEAASTYTWGANTTFTGYQATAHTSRKANQYVKYWDGGYDSTYFYGFAPYDRDITVTPAKDKTTMTFPAITSADSPIYLYAVQREENAAHVANNVTVPMQFKRLLSEIRIAFYEEVAGYDVELLGYNATYPDIYAVPANKDDSATPATYSGGQFLAKAQPIVTFKYDKVEKINYNLTGDGMDGDNIVCPIDYFFTAGSTTPTKKLGESKETMIIGPSKGVLPVTVTTPAAVNSGFTLNVSFKFIAKDTNEEIIVHNARVYVPATDTQWAANTRYTYIFRITNNVPGTTVPPEGNPAPSVDPTNKALYPIVFESVTVTDITEVEKGPYNVN